MNTDVDADLTSDFKSWPLTSSETPSNYGSTYVGAARNNFNLWGLISTFNIAGLLFTHCGGGTLGRPSRAIAVTAA
jgi:hypothetical protein